MSAFLLNCKFLLIISALFNIPNLIKKLPWVVIKDFKLEKQKKDY